MNERTILNLENYSKLQLIYAVYDALTYIPYEMMFGSTYWKGEVQPYFFDRIRLILELLNIDSSSIKDMNFDNFDCPYYSQKIWKLVEIIKAKYPNEIHAIYNNDELLSKLQEVDLTGTYGEDSDILKR